MMRGEVSTAASVADLIGERDFFLCFVQVNFPPTRKKGA